VRANRTLMPTLRDVPNDAVATSHKLLVRAGFIRQIGAGLWTYLPLGWRSHRRAEQIIRDEMNAIGGQEMLMPVLHPAEYWRRTGRYAIPELFKLEDRVGRDLVLSMTHEEIIAFHAAAEIRSYRDLPQIWYHIQTKERDEPRPQGGVLRTREFIMKDSYTLDRDRSGLDEGYARHETAYDRIFRRSGLRFYKVDSDVGMMGGSGAHEYMAPSEAGEDRIVLCDSCRYAANVEMAVSVPRPATVPVDEPLSDVATPGVTTIDGLARLLGIDQSATMKSVIVVPEDEQGGVVLALVRGDHRLHELKLAKALGTMYRPAQPDEIRTAFGADPGSIGAVGIRDGAVREILIDEAITTGGYVAGANRTGFHFRNAQFDRDFTARVADLRHAEAGEACSVCGGTLRIEPAIEVGNIFKLGTRYANAMGATYLDEAGAEQPIWMGSYGIGPARILAAAVEQFADDDGIVWPQTLAPYDVWITPIGDDALAAADALDAQLSSAGIDVLVDDRPLSAGVRFADADLIGVPIRVTIGKKLAANGVIEVRDRKTGATIDVPITAAAAHLERRVRDGQAVDHADTD
jgi:prolyl-tRNA synthetase